MGRERVPMSSKTLSWDKRCTCCATEHPRMSDSALFVCSSFIVTPSSVRVPVSPSQGSGPRCPNSGLEQVELNLSLPSSSTHPRVPAKASRIRWPRHFRGARLSSRSLVARAPSKRLPARPPPSGAPICTRHLTHCTGADVLTLPRFQFLKKAFEARLPQSLTEHLHVPNMRPAGNLSSSDYSFIQQEMYPKDLSFLSCIFCRIPKV